MSKRTASSLFKLLAATTLCALASISVAAQTRRTRPRTTTTTAQPSQTTSRATTQADAPSSDAANAQTSSATHAQSSSDPRAQSSVPDAAPSPSVPEEDADLVIIANVTAKELRFDAVPNPTVEFPGQPKRDTEWSAERTNLPPQVQPGVTYRDIGIRLKIVSRFADIDRIVAEALGEIPTSDDTMTTNNVAPTKNSDATPPTGAITNDATNATNDAQPTTNANATDSTRASGARRAATTRKKPAPRAARGMR
jgi:hypothetical protein